MTNIHDLEMANARAEVYRFLSTLLTENLSPDLLEQFLSKESASNVTALFRSRNIDSMFGQLIHAFAEGAVTAKDILVDFESLLRVPGANYIHPYESSYRDRAKKSDRVQWGLVNGPPARAVQNFYDRECLAVSTPAADFPDHIGAEFAFMGCLCRKFAESLDACGPADAETAHAKQVQFFKEHISQWSQPLAEQMRLKASTLFYRCVADMLDRFINMEEKFLLTTSNN
jgi:TorA maturation chaperone TorD